MSETILDPKDPSNPPILNELLCPLCNNVLNRPKQLPFCGHVYCADCLAKVGKPVGPAKPNALNIDCVACKVTSYLGSGLQCLRTNLPLYNITERVRAFEKSYTSQVNESVVPVRSSTSFLPRAPCCLLNEQENTVCSHCNVEFCQICRQEHMSELKEEAAKIAVNLESRVSTIAESIRNIDAKADLLDKSFAKSVRAFANKVKSSIHPLLTSMATATKTEMSKAVRDVQASSDRKRNRIRDILSKWRDPDLLCRYIIHLSDSVNAPGNGDVTSFLAELKELETEVNFLLSFDEDNSPHWDFLLNPELQAKVSTFQKNLRIGSAAFRVTPSSTSVSPDNEEVENNNDVETVLLPDIMMAENDRDFSRATIQPVDKTTFNMFQVGDDSDRDRESPQTPKQLSFIHLSPFNKSFYDSLEIISVIKGSNETGNAIAKPTGCCLVTPPGYHSMSAIIHSSRNISLISVFGLEATFYVQQPKDEPRSVYLGWDIACDSDGYIFVCCHQRRRILTFHLSTAFSQPDHVVPSIFAKIDDKLDKFSGLAVCDTRFELYSALNEGVAAFSLKDGSRRFVVSYPSISMHRNCCVMAVLNDDESDDKVSVVFSSMHGRRLHGLKLPKFCTQQHEEREMNDADELSDYEVEPYKTFIDEQHCRAIALDPLGSVIVHDSSSDTLQVIAAPGVVMSYLQTPDLACSETLGCTVLPPSDESSSALLIPDFRSSRVLLYGLPSTIPTTPALPE